MTQEPEKTKINKTSALKTASEQTLGACGCQWCDDVSDYVVKNPLCSLLLAALGGMVLGLLARSCRCRKCGCAEAGTCQSPETKP